MKSNSTRKKNLTELIVLNENIGPRYKLAQFFKSVTVDNHQRADWERYYDALKPEYDRLKKEDSLNRLVQSRLLEKDSTQWNPAEKQQFRQLHRHLEQSDIQLNSGLQLPDYTSTGYYVLVSADKTLNEAEYEKEKFQNYPVQIIYQEGNFRTVIPFSDYESAVKGLSAIQLIKADAYLINAAQWCPNPIPQNGYFICNESKLQINPVERTNYRLLLSPAAPELFKVQPLRKNIKTLPPTHSNTINNTYYWTDLCDLHKDVTIYPNAIHGILDKKPI